MFQYHEHMSICSDVQTKLPEATVVALAEIFKALGDTTRVRILDALSQSEVCVCDLAAMLGLTESAVSHQLRFLRSLRLVKSRRDGRHIYYTLADQHIVKLFEQGLEHVQEFSNSQVSTLNSQEKNPANEG
ncbi:MAG TPA: metalloregulator ArsR/SmtB family transcription factor [Vicinamibacterales bacterium]